ncbi:MAG TPA: hypothetical protein VI391_09890 [Thermoanaerobaculia bacterium]
MRKFVAVLAAVLLARCASLVHSDFEKIPVTSNPSGADVTLDCGRGATRIGTTPLTLMVHRKDTGCSVTITKNGWFGARVDLHRSIATALLLDFLAAGAAAIVANSNVDFSAQNGTSSGGDVTVSASGSGSVRPAVVGGVVLSGAVVVDAATGALFSHAPSRVDVALRRKD